MTDATAAVSVENHHDDDGGGSVTRSTTGGGNNTTVDRFSPDFISRMQHASVLFIGMIGCMMIKATRNITSSTIMSKGCEMVTTRDSNLNSGGSFHIPNANQKDAVSIAKEIIMDGATKALNSACYSNTMVYRVSFSIFCYFFIHYLSVSDLTCCIDGDSRYKMQTKFFWAKMILLCLLSVLTFFIPNQFFVWYAWACMFASALFLIAQVVILIDWSHYWNEEWGRRSDNNAKWQWYLLAIALGTYGFSIICTIVNYYYFTPRQDCNLHGVIITLNLLFGIGYTIIAIWVPHGSLVPSGIVFAYCTALSFTMMRGSDNEECNRLASAGNSFKLMIVTSIVSSFLLAWSVISLGGSRASLSMRTAQELAEEDPDETGSLSGYCYFYFIMMLGSMYLSMIVTNWEISGASDSDGQAQGVTTAFWVRFGTLILTILLYMWSLMAPYFCCKDRDYGFDTTWEE